MSYTYIVINLNQTDFTIEKRHPYTIIFKATCPVYRNQEFELTYTGTELNANISLPNYMDEFKNVIQEHFGYGPFDKKDIMEKLKAKFQFKVPME